MDMLKGMQMGMKKGMKKGMKMGMKMGRQMEMKIGMGKVCKRRKMNLFFPHITSPKIIIMVLLFVVFLTVQLKT